MASIKLASAVGQQREPIGILGGLDDAINKTGDAFQAQQVRNSEAAAKKKDQEQKLKDAIAGTVKIEPLDKAFPEEKKEYEDFATKKMAEYFVMTQDPKVTPSQLKKAGDDIEYQLRDRKNVYSRAYDAFGKVAELDKSKTHDTSLFNNWFMGKENTQVANMPNDDFMAASEADRAGKMVGENGMQATETKTTSQTVPYLNKSFEEKKKIDFASKADELVALKQPEITKAAQGYFGKDFKFDSYTKRTDKVSPTTGEYVFEFDEKQADLDAKRFASSMIGEGSFGDKNHAQMQRALEYEALRAGNEAGFSGDKLAAFVEEVVPQMAYDKFMADAKAAEAARMKNDKDVTKQPSKGMSINFNSAGGISKGAVSLDPIKKPSPTFIEAKYSPKIKKAEDRIAELEAVEKPNKFQLDEIKAQKGLIESLKKGEGLEQGEHFKFSNKKSGDDAFISIYPNNERKTFRLEDITPTKDGFEISGVERVKDSSGNNIDTPVFYPLTLDIYTDIINENPDAVDVFNKAGIKPNSEKAAIKTEAPKGETAEQRRARLKKELIK